MQHPDTDRGASLRSYPNLRTAAEILDVSGSTLSRREDLEEYRRGERDRVLPAREVLRLATIYRKRSLNDVAQALLDLARETQDGDVGGIEEEVEGFFAGRSISAEELENFTLLARRLLPQGLSEKVEAALQTERNDQPDLIGGYTPPPAKP